MTRQAPSPEPIIVQSKHHDELRIHLTDCNRDDTRVQHKEGNTCSQLEKKVVSGVQRFTNRRFTAEPMTLFPLLLKKCPFCQHRLSIAQHKEMCDKPEEFDAWIEDEKDVDEPGEFIGALELCTHCCYWRWHHLDSLFYGGRGISYFHTYTSFLSKIEEFSEVLPEGCFTELAQWIRRHPRVWNTINPHRLERFVADIFRANYVGAEVVHVGKPDDGGVDVLFIDTHKERWIIQVKRRESSRAAEPVGTIRNLLGTMLLEKASYGIVVSTADHFTYRACQAAKRSRECGMIVRLIDRGKLDRMLNPLLPRYSWIDPLTTNYPHIVPHIRLQLADATGEQLKLFKRVPRVKTRA